MVGLCGVVAACGALPGPSSPSDAVVERLVVSMGTSLRVEVVAKDRPTALRASEAAVRAVEAAEQRLSTWRPDSELSRFLAAPVGATVPSSAALCRDVRAASRFCEATGGAFDPTVGALVAAYDLRGEGRWPSPSELEAAGAAQGMAQVHVEGAALRRSAAVRIDAGAFGKGVGLDAAAAAATAAGATAARFDFGGQLLVTDASAPVTFEVADPRDRERAALRLRVRSGSLATTGNSERGRVVGGRPLGHVLDPRTGAPAADFGAVTVWAERALDADCLSTACFVLGPSEAIALAERTDGVEAVALIVSPTNGALSARVSSGLKGRVEALLPDLTIQ